jgi:Fn3 associated/Fibronectin type III domain
MRAKLDRARHERAATATEGSPRAHRRSARARVGAAAAVAAVSITGLGVWSVTAGAVAPLPTFPDNLVVFPDRDFISVEGFSGYPGQMALVEVYRPSVDGVVGSARAEVSGTDVAFEINHPGGVCWGNGTSLNVTPDILPGDVVSLEIGGNVLAATTVGDSYVTTGSTLSPDGLTMTVTGRIGPSVDRDNFEQRIIEPALKDTIIGRRDIRATPGDPVQETGYTSQVTFSGDTFTATYVFETADVAAIADAAGGERAMTWEFTDPDANRQGLTIAEFGEPGGPGMGGCPNGPAQTGPVPPSNIAAALSSDGTSVRVDWIPAVAVPGTPAITGYRVTAVDLQESSGEQVEIGRRINNVAASGTTITGLDPSRSYRIEVVSVSSAGLTNPPALAAVAVDGTPPVITANPGGNSFSVPQLVTLTANEPGVEIYYTTNGDDPIQSGGNLADTAMLYTGPIPVDVSGTLTFAGFDPSGNASDPVTETYAITNDPLPGASTIVSGTPGLASVELTWTAADPGAPTYAIVDYLVSVYDSADGTTPIRQVNANGPVTTLVIDGLEGVAGHWFSVQAKNDANSAWGPASNRFGPVEPQGEVVADAGTDRLNVVRGTVVPLTGTGSAGTYQWVQVQSASNPIPLVGPSDPNYVSIFAAGTPNANFVMPMYQPGRTTGALYFQLTITGTNGSDSDIVAIFPRNDTLSGIAARWKANDFRVTGTGAIDGATVTVRNATTGAVIGSGTVVTGAFDVRVRTGVANPGQILVDSNHGGTFGPVGVAAR